MAGGPMLQMWESILPLVKDLRVRFALAMLGNLVILWFLLTYFKNLIPDLPAEFNDLPHEKGTLSMARSSDPNSANSQFFICFQAAPFLDRNYTVFGKVVEGMEHIDKIKKGDSNNNGSVTDPDKIISFKSL